VFHDFDVDRQHLTDERDEACAEVEQLRAVLRRIASGVGALTVAEQRLVADAVASGEEPNPARVLARYALADEYETHVTEPCPTVPVELAGRIVHLDAGVAPLVLALNRVPGVQTVWSCEGHPQSRIDPRAYVEVECEGVRFRIEVERERLAALTKLVERRGASSARGG
jgi:hypothetical protein